MDGWQRRYRLSNGPGGLGVSCTAEGLALAGVPLLAKGAGGFQVRPAAEVAVLLRRAYAGAEPGAAVLPGLTRIADALNRGDLAQAMIRAVHLRLPELDWDAAVRLTRANDNLAKYSPDQPRDWHGRWTDGAGGERGADGAVEAKPKEADRNPEPGKAIAGSDKKDADGPKATGLPPVSSASDFAIPATPNDAPPVLRFADENQQQMDTYWQESLAPLLNAHGAKPPEGQDEWVVEQGATIVARRSDGVLEFQNKGGLNRKNSDKSGKFEPDLKLKEPDKYTVLGTGHTHPYDSGATDISLSGNDSAYLMDNGINFSLVQSGKGQFLFLKTKETLRSKDYERGGSGFVENFQENEKSIFQHKLPELFSVASREAAIEAAKMYHLAYYEGRNGTLYRVYPP
ncbi:hypothetical protein [Azospirillum sp. B4]|uniref:hypothetical protein n=1 Tax=Azospirillum sp. B4 TaxID=95605 RepID=UPI0011DDB5D9|nr:hypothetical protein [Azospirillum sp. B4]